MSPGGLAADLGYAYPRPHLLQRAVQAFAGSRLGARLTPVTLAPMDRFVSRLTRGRVSLPVLLAGLPVLELVVVGRKSGLRRVTHLIAIPFGQELAVLGTNFGQPRTPAWVLNLEDHPRATVRHRGESREVVARPATDEERAAVMASAGAVFAGAVRYEERLAGRRRVRVFVLEPVSD